jgi:hypothetical protein
VYKRQQLPNYQQIPAKWRAVVKRQWHSLYENRSRNQAVWSQCTANTSKTDFRENFRGWLRHCTGRRWSLFRFQMESKEFSIDLIFPIRNRSENQEYLPGQGVGLRVGVKAAGALSWQSCHFQVQIIWKSRSLKLLEP